MFNISTATVNKTTKSKNTDKIEAERLEGTLGIKGCSGGDIKDRAHKDAVSLRKDRRKEEVQKRRRAMMIGSEPDWFPPVDDHPPVGFNPREDIASMGIQDALNYQKTTGMDTEAFINGVANKMKFGMPDFSPLC